MLTPNQMQLTMSDEAIVDVYTFGQKNNPCIIISPALMGNVQSYSPIIDNLVNNQDYYVVFANLRAHVAKEKKQNKGKGMRLSRLSSDLHEVMQQLNCQRPILLGHSIGCAVIWGTIEIYGQHNMSGFIFLDQPPALMLTENNKMGYDPSWSVFDINNYATLSKQMLQMQSKAAFKDFVIEQYSNGFITDEARKQGLFDQWIDAAESMDPANIMRSMIETLNHDWTDLIPNIKLPTLIVGGKASLTPWESQCWMGEQIKDSTVLILEKDQGGVHGMFLDSTGATLLNNAIDQFLQAISN